jgi:hypothetical protein
MENDVTEKKVLLVTGASRGMGVDIAKAALAAGYAVVATGRNPAKVAQAVGASDDLLTVALDVTDPAGAQAAVQAAMDRFGRIDVLVNNAGNFIAGFFEEITPDKFRAQVETNLSTADLPGLLRQGGRPAGPPPRRPNPPAPRCVDEGRRDRTVSGDPFDRGQEKTAAERRTAVAVSAARWAASPTGRLRNSGVLASTQ